MTSNDLRIEQALYGSAGPEGRRLLARSPGFHEDWLPQVDRLCSGFGERSVSVSCPLAVMAQPFGPRQVAVVQVADQAGALTFRLLIQSRTLYAALGDPFRIADEYPPPWDARGELPTLEWTAGPLPRRTVEAIQQVLDVPSSATLLGGVQALLDGGRLAFERTGPDPRLVRSLWALLPDAARAELWPATFAFGNAHGFDVAVVPRADGPDYVGYIFEEQSGDYPEGRYELALQIAVESADQTTMDVLFARRSRSQILRLGFVILGLLVFIPLFVFACIPGPRPQRKAAPARKTAAAASRLFLSVNQQHVRHVQG
jgi:hypothetical protein